MRYYIGLMSGTSLDGVDGVLMEIDDDGAQFRTQFKLLSSSFLPYSSDLRASLLALQSSGEDEIHRSCLVANQLVLVYAECVLELLRKSRIGSEQVVAIGVHGQTVRHRPELGYTWQVNNPALLAELTEIDVIADFRSRDIAAGGQGAPLVPAFHRSVFGAPNKTRVVANIGGICNISILHADGRTRGFDTGPGNVLMDAWISEHIEGRYYDSNGDWARQGKVNDDLLTHLKDEPFLGLAPPKSTGRDLFHSGWLNEKLTCFTNDNEVVSPVDVQATLCAYTAHTLVDEINAHAPDVQQVFLCGGGAYNATLVNMIRLLLKTVSVESTELLGIAPNHVEAMAFAWLAYRHTKRLSGNLAEVTGAPGERILGALYPR